jgi:endonuclease-3
LRELWLRKQDSAFLFHSAVHDRNQSQKEERSARITRRERPITFVLVRVFRLCHFVDHVPTGVNKSIPPFTKVIRRLESHYGHPARPKLKDPLALILYENIGYLIDDDRRDAAFAVLKRDVGLRATDILSAPLEELVVITRLAGIHPELRAARLHEIAQIVLSDFAGDLRKALQLPLPKAINALKKFPSIGKPGAEKILLLTRTHPVLALDSNGLRVLLRLGFGEEQRSYSASYASTQASIKGQLGNDCGLLIGAHLLLRRHGKELCRNNNPCVCGLPLEVRLFVL